MRTALVMALASLAVTACAGAGPPDAAVGSPGPSPGGAVTTVAPGGAGQSDVQAHGEPVPAASPADLAEQLAAAETAIRDPATPPARLRHVGWMQQVAYRILVRNPAWKSEVFALLPPPLRPAAEANVAAGEELTRLSSTPQPDLPQWRIVVPAPAEELLGYYREAEAAFGVPWRYLAAIHLVETRMGRIRGTSVAGAQGPMQFIPSSWELYGAGGDINDNRDAILAAARHLVAGGAPSDMAAALYAYNPSQRYVRAVTAYANQIGADDRAYLGYYHWQVYYGDRLMPEGYGA